MGGGQKFFSPDYGEKNTDLLENDRSVQQFGRVDGPTNSTIATMSKLCRTRQLYYIITAPTSLTKMSMKYFPAEFEQFLT